ncbi:MAG: response regulator transcription factor [Chlorobi bacterium]|nr:response regulator transcription factor [Chlorobiota bacterium]
MPQNSEKIKIIIADDHEVISSGIIALLQDEKDILIIKTVNNGKELLSILEELKPDIILMDMNMPEMNGLEATAIIKEKYPKIKVLVLTIYDDISLVKKFKSLNVHGYILKNVSKLELVTAIQNIFKGKTHYSHEITDNLLNNIKDYNKEEIDSSLTAREIEILTLIAEGLSNSAIGKRLYISPRTVDTHRTNLMKKLNINNIAGLVKYAIMHDLVE